MSILEFIRELSHSQLIILSLFVIGIIWFIAHPYYDLTHLNGIEEALKKIAEELKQLREEIKKGKEE